MKNKKRDLSKKPLSYIFRNDANKSIEIHHNNKKIIVLFSDFENFSKFIVGVGISYGLVSKNSLKDVLEFKPFDGVKRSKPKKTVDISKK